MTDQNENPELEDAPLVHWVPACVPAMPPSALCEALNVIEENGWIVVHVATLPIQTKTNLAVPGGQNIVLAHTIYAAGSAESFKDYYGFDYSMENLQKAFDRGLKKA